MTSSHVRRTPALRLATSSALNDDGRRGPALRRDAGVTQGPWGGREAARAEFDWTSGVWAAA